MNTPNLCPRCAKPLAANAPQGLCPECLLKAAFPTGSAPGADTSRRFQFTPPTTAELAMHFPNFEIVALIGQGGMGAVYKARQPSLDRFVALKILPPETSRHPAFAERFTREARALAKLNHPNIVAVYDFGRAGEFHYLTMEFVDGVNLRHVLNTAKMTPSQALAIVPPICAALQFAHDRGIVHRDIKPENILIEKTGTVKIADFGLAKLMGTAAGEAITGVGDVMGTPHYMAPEQVERPQEVDHRADIYSLGVVFYQMLTGELPLGRFGPPSSRVQVDVRLDDIVLRALEKQPELRYQQASVLKTEVESVAIDPAASGPTGERKRSNYWDNLRRQLGLPAFAVPPPPRAGGNGPNATADGIHLVLPVTSPKLPPRCVKTNAAVEAEEVHRTRFEWIPPVVFFSLLLTPVAFAICYFLFRRFIWIDVPLTRKARMAVWRARWLTTIGGLLGFLVILIGVAQGSPILALATGIATVLILVFGGRQSTLLRITWVQDGEARFLGAGREFLASLPRR